jgi:hypothetical protein
MTASWEMLLGCTLDPGQGGGMQPSQWQLLGVVSQVGLVGWSRIMFLENFVKRTWLQESLEVLVSGAGAAWRSRLPGDLALSKRGRPRCQ